MSGPPDCDECGHPKRSHRYGGRNASGTYTFHSSCKREACDCTQYTHPERGKLR